MRDFRHALGERALRASLVASLAFSAFTAFTSTAWAESVGRTADVPPHSEPVATSPTSAPLSGSAQLAERGARFSAAGKVMEAIEAYSEAIRLDPHNGEALVALGKLRAGLGEAHEAEMLFTAATFIRNVAAEAYAERGRLRKAQGHDALAMDDLERAAELSPDDVTAAAELSAWHVAHRAWLPALAIWRRAAASAPDPQTEHRAMVQARALTVLAGTLDCVGAGRAADRSWTRRALARIGKQ